MIQFQLPPPVPATPKPSVRWCDEPPYFRARLEAATGSQQMQILASTDVCAEHLGDAVHDLTVWAQEARMHGQVVVLAIGAPEPCQRAGDQGNSGGPFVSSFAFSVIPIIPMAAGSPPGYQPMPSVRPAPSAYDPCPDRRYE
jgi:hypothetical protein